MVPNHQPDDFTDFTDLTIENDDLISQASEFNMN